MSDGVSEPLSIVPFLQALNELKGSDLHCKVGSPPRIRIDGRLRRLQAPDLTTEDTEHMVEEVLRHDLREEFAKTNEADFAYSVPGVGRFRVNAFRARGSAGLVLRRVSFGAIPLDMLGVPDVIKQLALEPRGLVLVTGPTGSGKTTTLAGMVDHINTNREVHIVTIEDPIEIMHSDSLSMINQREVRLDTADFAVALRAAMRQDPDVILVGEMRDTETVKAALAAAETGHFVMSTLHTADARGDHRPRSSTSSRRTSTSRSGSRSPARCGASSASGWSRGPTGRAAAWRWRSASSPAGSPRRSPTRTRPTPSPT